MAGNTINVQGNYIDVHDNEVVNLNIDKATVAMAGAGGLAIRGNCQEEGEQRNKAAVLTENERFMAIMGKAVEKGFCLKEGWQYRWKVKVEAAYFASVASYTFGLSKKRDHDGDECISWIPFEALFGLKGLRLSYNDYQKCATKVRRKGDIDGLFH